MLNLKIFYFRYDLFSYISKTFKEKKNIMEIKSLEIRVPIRQSSCSVISDSLQPHDCRTARLPCLSPTPQTHVHRVGDAIQPSHPLSPSSTPAFNLPQHQGIFQWLSSSHQVTKVLDLQLQPSVFPMNIQGWFLSGLTSWISLDSMGLSRVFSNTTDQKHQFFGTQLSLRKWLS